MTRIVFRDIDEFSHAVGGVIGRFIPTARSTEEWWVQSVDSGRIQTQVLQVGGQVTFAGDGKRDQIALLIPLIDHEKIRTDGQLLNPCSFLLIQAGQPFTFSTSEATRWAGIVVPSDHELLAHELMKSHLSRLFHDAPTARTDTTAERLSRIRLLVARLSAAVDSGSFDSAAVRCAQEEILVAASRALESSTKERSRQLGRPAFSRSQIIAKVLDLFETSADAPLFIADLCRATGVAERTLRNVFHEYFGVGPMRFLKVRQLHEIRVALLAADPTRDTVTGVAARFGICDFSLFARNYKALFDESPSYTLRTAPNAAQRRPTARDTWLQYATRAFSSKASGIVL